MAILIKKCANPKCADIIGLSERKDKKFCSKECKTKVHNEKNKIDNSNWDKVLDKYGDLPIEPFIPFPRWLKENYYPPRIIKKK